MDHARNRLPSAAGRHGLCNRPGETQGQGIRVLRVANCGSYTAQWSLAQGNHTLQPLPTGKSKAIEIVAKDPLTFATRILVDVWACGAPPGVLRWPITFWPL